MFVLALTTAAMAQDPELRCPHPEPAQLQAVVDEGAPPRTRTDGNIERGTVSSLTRASGTRNTADLFLQPDSWTSWRVEPSLAVAPLQARSVASRQELPNSYAQRVRRTTGIALALGGLSLGAATMSFIGVRRGSTALVYAGALAPFFAAGASVSAVMGAVSLERAGAHAPVFLGALSAMSGLIVLGGVVVPMTMFASGMDRRVLIYSVVVPPLAASIPAVLAMAQAGVNQHRMRVQITPRTDGAVLGLEGRW